MKKPTLEQLQTVWQRILADPQARKALDTLKQEGFAIDHLIPHDLTYPCWADYFAEIPFLPNRPSRRHLRSAKSLRKYLSLVKLLRDFGARAGDRFCEVRATRKNQICHGSGANFAVDFEQTADLIEKFISSNWSFRHRNPRGTLL